jgi:type IV secretory pathway VirB10-like protein
MKRPPFPSPPAEIESPVFQRTGQMTMQVRQPDSPWTLGLGIAVAVILGVIVFATLSAGRQARADAAATRANQVRASAPSPQPAPAMTLAQATPAPAPAPAQALPTPPPQPPPGPDESTELHAPLMVVDQSDSRTATATASPLASPAGRGADTSGGSAEERFAAQVASGGVETSRATRLTDLRHTVPQGTVIPAVLETAINSDLPGSVRAVVSRDVTGFDGAEVLIPRGSKLIGQYRSGMALGQSRAFVIWSRILTPDGVSIDVGSPAADTLGRGGLSGQTDTHFFERFGSSILLSVLNAGLQAAANAGSSGTSVIIGSPVQAANLAAMAPQTNNIPVTIKVMQGTPLQVFLVRDLDFSGVAAARR